MAVRSRTAHFGDAQLHTEQFRSERGVVFGARQQSREVLVGPREHEVAHRHGAGQRADAVVYAGHEFGDQRADLHVLLCFGRECVVGAQTLGVFAAPQHQRRDEQAGGGGGEGGDDEGAAWIAACKQASAVPERRRARRHRVVREPARQFLGECGRRRGAPRRVGFACGGEHGGEVGVGHRHQFAA